MALAVLVLVAIGPLVKPLTVQPGSRYALSAALVDDHSVRIDPYAATTKPGDRVDAADGHLYSDKAPGQPVLAAPFYALARAVGAEPATVTRVNANLGVWWVTLWSSVVPAAALVVMMQLVVARRRPEASTPVALSLLFATPMLVWSVELYGHLLATAFVFGSWTLLTGRRRDALATVGAGLLGGLAVATENPVALVVAVVAMTLVVDRDWRRLGWFVLGALPSAVALAVYNAVAFGGPFTSAYSLHKGVGASNQTDLATGAPRPSVVVQLLVGSRGVVLTPLVLVGLGAALYIVIRRLTDLRDAAVALGAFGALLLFEVTRRTDWPGPLGGEMPAPRHLIPAIPFLAVPLALAWRRWRVVYLLAAAVGLFLMAWPTVLSHLIPADAPYIAWYRQVWHDQGVAPTLYTMAMGGVGWLVHGATVLVAGMWVVAEHRRAVALRLRPSRAVPA